MRRQYLVFASTPRLLLILVTFSVLVAASTVTAQEPAVARDDRAPYPRETYVWPYETGPFYADAPPAAVALDAPGVFVSEVGWIDLADGDLPFAPELTATNRLHELETQYFIVQTLMDPESRREVLTAIRGAGGEVVRYLPNATVVARLNLAAYDAIAGSTGLSIVEPYHPALKLHPRIGREPLPDPIRATSATYRLDVMLWEGEDGHAVAATLAELGATEIKVWGDQLRLEAHRDLLPQIAALEPVRMIYETIPVHPLTEETTTTMQTGQHNSGATPYHDVEIDGAGAGGSICDPTTDPWWTHCETDGQCAGDCNTPATQILMTLDTGIQLDAGELADSRGGPGTPGAGHRKVRVYEPTNQFGGEGDLSGCDAPGQGGFTHGHVVASTALGNASRVSPAYGPGFYAFDSAGNQWDLDGVAPGAALITYDGQRTSQAASCWDPLYDTITPGDLYNPGMPSFSALGAAHAAGARIVNFSWGAPGNFYTANATDIDTFIEDNPEALVFVSAGNSSVDYDPPGGDGRPDPLTLSSPATTKNGLAIGASFNADTTDSPNSRASFSSIGPAVSTMTNRTAPQLMAPGAEPPGGGNLGLRSEFSCRSNDNDQGGTVECDIYRGFEGTSVSSAAAAGAALLVRDYFFQGFYPDRRPSVADGVGTISAALVKAILAASAEFMTGDNLTQAYRWNNEQGYGRIQLDNALPLENWPASASGLIVHDVIDSVGNVSDLSLPPTVLMDGSTGAQFEVCNDEEELRVVLAWTDPADANLLNNLDLVLTSPSGKEYRGNYFTDDNDRDGVSTPFPFEDCPAIGDTSANGEVDAGPWSLPVCSNTGIPGFNETVVDFDQTNPIEGIFLSPDPDGNGSSQDGSCDLLSSNPGGTDGSGACGNDIDCAADPTFPQAGDWCIGGTKQPEVGFWTIEIYAGTPFSSPSQDFAVAIAGGACLGSSVNLDRSDYSCRGPLTIVVTEQDDFTDFGCNRSSGCPSAEIQNRTTLRVFDEELNLVDCEGPDCLDPVPGPSFEPINPQALVFRSDVINITDATVPTPGNGVLDAREGDTIEVTYDDNGVLRTSSAGMSCRLAIDSGLVQFVQIGQDSDVYLQGGCERAAQRQGESVGFFEFGAPDAYMDAGELIQFNFAFALAEAAGLENVMAELKCVSIDGDSPADCRPNGFGCDPVECGGECDPRRENNALCQELTILDSPKRIGTVPVDGFASANFAVRMRTEEEFDGGTPTVEMVLSLFDDTAGKTAPGVAVSRQRLNVDEIEKLYNTDFPSGGTGIVFDLDNNEVEDNPITDPAGLAGLDYRFETRTYSDLTAGKNAAGETVTRNQNLLSPWNFDHNDGGFTSGLAGPTDEAAADLFGIDNTGEDKNFNGIEDGVCGFDPSIECYRFPSDPRCPVDPSCFSTEDNGAVDSFDPIHHNQRGGCGWQTKALHSCTIIEERGCTDDDDCWGECQLPSNQFLSTFTPCNGANCPLVNQCNEFISTANILGPCTSDADCGGAPGSCQLVGQICRDFAGTCDLGSTASTGGVLHTGAIGDYGAAPCDGGESSQCANYEVISGSDAALIWWSLWLTPVIEKVDQSIGSDGLPNASIEITDWAWNQSIDLADVNVAYTWEFDTDLDTLFPVDLLSDSTALGFGFGPYGPVTAAGDPQMTGGFDLFAPMARCSGSLAVCQVDTDCPAGSCSLDPGLECHVNAECADQVAGICIGAEVCDQSEVSVNGVVGYNREGQNGCFFEGAGTIPANFRDDLGFAWPPDDDLDNDGDLFVDEFVTPAGPIRNAGITDFDGPDMRLITLEDLFGNTGNRFQAAIGLINLEGTLTDEADAGYGLAVDDMYVEWREVGLGQDVTYCESGGSCATLEVPTTIQYEGNTEVVLSLVETTPYNSACSGGPRVGEVCFTANGDDDCTPGTCDPVLNDCDLDGRFDGPGDGGDCDGDGTPDVVVRATSAAEVWGEVVVLNQVGGPDSPVFRGGLTTSLVADNPGVLFLAPNGADQPTVDVTYTDLEDGTGRACLNSAIAEQQGYVQTTAWVVVPSCDLAVVAHLLTDNGDGDFIADSDETVTLDFAVRNNCGFDLTNCTAQLTTNSPSIECSTRPQVVFGDVPADGAVHWSPEAFEFKLDSVTADRDAQGLVPNDPLWAQLEISFACSEIETTRSPQRLALPLDLNVSDLDQSSSAWSEPFESGGLGKFSAENLDSAIPGAGDGWRCQYNDPDWINSNTYGSPIASECFPGFDPAHAAAVFWQIDGTGVGSPDGGRAKSGTRSMYYGEFHQPSGGFTTPQGVVESVRTTNPINLGVGSPTLSFWHQISLADHRLLSTTLRPRRSADRAVVQIQLVDEFDTPISPWEVLVPVQNSYDEQAGDAFTRCMFDPVDDGNTEDDFFDPTDPFRDSGPSSTCFPAHSFGYLGDTDELFDVTNTGNATVGPEPGDAPALGTGTWVETVVDLSVYRGRRARLRFLVSAFKGPAESWEVEYGLNPDPREDGWWIDDVEVDDTLAGPAEVVNDSFALGTCSGNGATCIGRCRFSMDFCDGDNPCGTFDGDCVAPCPVGQNCSGPPPGCGPTCTAVTANVFVEPGEMNNPSLIETSVPGQPVSFDAAAPFDPATGAMPSVADACLDGMLQFRFCRSGDWDCDDAGDEVFRGWSGNPRLTVTPPAPGFYVVEVRCSTDPGCFDVRQIEVWVNCPGTEINSLPLTKLRAVDKNTLEWTGAPIDVDVWTSIALTSSSQLAGDAGSAYPGTPSFLTAVNSIPMPDPMPQEPPEPPELLEPGQFRGYLVKLAEGLNTFEEGFFCNSRSWRSGGVGEIPEDEDARGQPLSPIGRDKRLGDPFPLMQNKAAARVDRPADAVERERSVGRARAR